MINYLKEYYRVGTNRKLFRSIVDDVEAQESKLYLDWMGYYCSVFDCVRICIISKNSL